MRWPTMAAWMMSSGLMGAPPEIAVAPACAPPKGRSTVRSAGICDLEVKIFLILKQPSSWMTSIVFMEFWFIAAAWV